MTGIVDFRTELLDELGAPISGSNPLPVSSTGGGGGGGTLDSYVLNDFADGNPLYVGKVKSNGTWLVQRYSSSGEMRYANLSNNAGVTTYATAWAGRTGLTYNLFQTLTGV